MIQISARLDCVENLTRQRHDRDQTENQQNAATVDSCFELVGSRQHGLAQQKVEHQRESIFYQMHVVADFGWAQIQTSVHVIARDYEQCTKELKYHVAVAIS